MSCLFSGPYATIGVHTDLTCPTCSEILFFEPVELLDPIKCPTTAITPELREGQVEIANLIYDRLFFSGIQDPDAGEAPLGLMEPYLIEGGVGVGKTLGYICGFAPILWTFTGSARGRGLPGSAPKSYVPPVIRGEKALTEIEPLPWEEDVLDFRHRGGRVPMRAVISTESKGLQAQVSQDYARLSSWIADLYRRHGHNIRIYAYSIQGRANYTCRKILTATTQPERMYRHIENRLGMSIRDLEWENVVTELLSVLDVAHAEDLEAGTISKSQETARAMNIAARLGTTGIVVDEMLASLVPVGCSTPKCVHRTTCSLQRAQSAIRNDSISNKNTGLVIANHHWTAVNYKLMGVTSGSQYLEMAHIIIADEAHKLPAIVSDTWRSEVTEVKVTSLMRRIMTSSVVTKNIDGDGPGADLAEEIRGRVRDVNMSTTDVFKAVANLHAYVIKEGEAKSTTDPNVRSIEHASAWINKPVVTLFGVEGLRVNSPQCLTEYLDAVQKLKLHVSSLVSSLKHRSSQSGNGYSVRSLEGLSPEVYTEAEELITELSNMLNPAWTSKLSYKSGGEAAVLMTSPPNIAKLLCTAVGAPLFVLTSGTLTRTGSDVTDGMSQILPNTFTTETGRVLSLKPKYLHVASPFDYRTNAVMYAPKDPRTSPPNSKAPATMKGMWYSALASHILEVVDLTKGYAFILCTSIMDMEAFRRGLRDPLISRGIECRTQKDFKDTESAIEWYKEVANKTLITRDPGPLMFGVSSLWTGVSIPGDALQAVIVTKIPFPPPTGVDYMLAEKTYGSHGVFDGWSLPEAIKQLRQGEGRLIRTTTDTGVFALLDNRLWDKSYGQGVLLNLQTRHNLASTPAELAQKWSKIKTK
jgi:Rad3-related DNA helicase